MKIIQVIDLDGTTVKVDETNPSEPKIVVVAARTRAKYIGGSRAVYDEEL